MMEMVYGFGALAGWITAAFLAIRNGGLKAEIADADNAREKANEQVQELAKDYNDYYNRSEKRFKAYEDTIQDLKKEILASSVPGSVRDALNRLLQKAGGDDNKK